MRSPGRPQTAQWSKLRLADIAGNYVSYFSVVRKLKVEFNVIFTNDIIIKCMQSNTKIIFE